MKYVNLSVIFMQPGLVSLTFTVQVGGVFVL